MTARRLGFTLVEVVIVLAILGIVAAVTAPSLATLGRQDELTEAANSVARLLRQARLAALERAVPVSAVIEPAGRKYLVSVESDDAPVILAQGSMPLPPSVRLLSDRPRVRFDFRPLGSAEPDSLAVTGDGGTALVGVDRWSGEVYVKRGGGTAGQRGRVHEGILGGGKQR
jgi:type II secretion system protein H